MKRVQKKQGATKEQRRKASVSFSYFVSVKNHSTSGKILVCEVILLEPGDTDPKTVRHFDPLVKRIELRERNARTSR